MQTINKILVSWCIVFAVTGSACSKRSTPVHPLDTLRIGIGNETVTLDPAKAKDIASRRIVNDLFSGLVDLDQKNHPIPGMAAKWDISPDGKTYTFYLRRNLKFSNGSPINATDFVYTYQRLIDPVTTSGYSYILSGVLNGQAIIHRQLPPSSLGVYAKDHYIVVIKLAYPDNNFLNYLATSAVGVVSNSVIERYKSKWIERRHIVTSGAYFVVEYIANDYIVLKKNPHFYAPKDVTIPFVKYFFYPNPSSAIANYKAGNIDLVEQYIPLNQYENLKQEFSKEMYTSLQESKCRCEYIKLVKPYVKNPDLGNNHFNGEQSQWIKFSNLDKR